MRVMTHEEADSRPGQATELKVQQQYKVWQLRSVFVRVPMAGPHLNTREGILGPSRCPSLGRGPRSRRAQK